MITEDYVSFETAKLLKEKGFDSNTNCYYIEDSVTRTLFYSPIEENHNASIENNELDVHINISSGKMSSPTLQMAMKWLREKHNQNITVKAHNNVARLKTIYYVEVQNLSEPAEKDFCVNGCTFKDTYEEASEAAIKYCLEKLV